MPGPLRDNLQPTDFADADCRVSPWRDFDGYKVRAVRVWICRVAGGYWFQRHEWQRADRNSTQLENWIFYGYHPRKQHSPTDLPAPAEDDA